MNRKKVLMFLSIVLTLIIFTGCTTNKNNDNNESPENVKENINKENEDEVVDENEDKDSEKSNNYIDLEEAKKIALKKVNNEDGVIVDYELEGTWNNYTHHEFEIQLDNEKHEIKVDAKTGDIIKTESKQNDHKIAEYDKYIGFDEAKKIVLDNMNDKNHIITEFDLENHNKENKGAYYEFEIHSENREYEIKIDAESGEVISR